MPAARRVTPFALAVALGLGLTACGDDAADTAGAASAPTASPSGTAAGGVLSGPGYTAVSDVAPHAALGADAAAIRELLAVAKEGKPVDWSAVGTVFTAGGASRKSDGSLRTFATLVADHPATAAVTAALTSSAPDAARAQTVDKGLTVLLAAKVLGELATAAEKVAAKALDPATGAAHNVDEAWAFYVAQEQGPALTADKRGKDFSRPTLRAAVVTALADAQRAAVAGDAAGLQRATAATKVGLDHIFYLATYKYLDHGGDAVKQAEGSAFYLALQARVAAVDPAADRAVTATFAGGDAAAGRAALNTPAVLQALGLSALKVTS